MDAHFHRRLFTTPKPGNNPMEMNYPTKPTLLWDGKCVFCAHWIHRWKKTSVRSV